MIASLSPGQISVFILPARLDQILRISACFPWLLNDHTGNHVRNLSLYSVSAVFSSSFATFLPIQAPAGLPHSAEQITHDGSWRLRRFNFLLFYHSKADHFQTTSLGARLRFQAAQICASPTPKSPLPNSPRMTSPPQNLAAAPILA